MSRTHRHRDRDAHGRLLRKYRHPHHGVRFPRGAPKWWRKLYMSRPRRRKNRMLCHLVEKGVDPEGLVFPLGNHKPHVYYW
ncbi:MAG: hypothetical protein ACE5OQ_13905 [Woeseia sp.]